MTLIGLRILSLVTILAVSVSSSRSATSTFGDLAEGHRSLQTCNVTICESGDDSQIGSPDLILPIFPDGATTCAQVAQLLASQDQNVCTTVATYAEFLSLGAYCGCAGQQAPGICAACSAGGQVVDPTLEFTVPLLEGVTFTCEQGEAFVSYLTSDLACGGFTSIFDSTCCMDGATPTTPTMSGAPVASPVVTAAPVAGAPFTAAPVMGAPFTAAPVAGTTPSTMTPSMMTTPSPVSSTTDPSIMPAAASDYPSTVTPATDDSTESPTEGEGPPTRPSATSPSAASPSAPTRPSAPSPSSPSSPSTNTTSAGASLFVGQACVVALFTAFASTWTME